MAGKNLDVRSLKFAKFFKVFAKFFEAVMKYFEVVRSCEATKLPPKFDVPTFLRKRHT